MAGVIKVLIQPKAKVIKVSTQGPPGVTPEELADMQAAIADRLTQQESDDRYWRLSTDLVTQAELGDAIAAESTARQNADTALETALTAGVVWIGPNNIQWSAASKPTVRPISVNGSNALVAGDKWLKTTDNTWHDWNGTYWLKKVPPVMVRAVGYDINNMFYTVNILPPLSSDGYPRFFLRQIRVYVTFGLVTWDSDNKVDLQLRMASRDASIGSPIVLPDTVESLAGIYNKRIVATKTYNQFVGFPDDFTGTGALEIRTVNRVGDPNPSEGSTLYEIEMFPVEL